jgi:hypothetical protein
MRLKGALQMEKHVVSIPAQFRVFAGTAALAVFAGCAGAGTGSAVSNLPPAASRNGGTDQSARQMAILHSVLPPGVASRLFARAARSAPTRFARPQQCPKQPLAFISDFSLNVVYEADKVAECTTPLGGFQNPQGIAVDRQRNLWVANSGADNILEFAPPYNGAPIKTLSDPYGEPADVCVDLKGNVAVTNLVGDEYDGNIVLYAPGAVSPTGMATEPEYTYPYFCAFASNGNLAFDALNYNSNTTNLGLIYAGNSNNMNAVINTLTFTNEIAFPGGVQVPDRGGLAVLDQEGQVIDSYKNPKDLNLGAPISVTSLGQAGDPVQFAFWPKSKVALAADAYYDQTEAYYYPAGGNPFNTYGFNNGGVPIGIGHVDTEQFIPKGRQSANAGLLP